MPTTPGLPDDGRLFNVSAEAGLLAGLLPDPLALVEPAPVTDRHVAGDLLPARDRVLSELPHHAIAHFACHGTHDPADPDGGRLLLHDHRDRPLTVADLARVKLEHAELAYLSACATALNTNAVILDEAIHLTSAFQLAGFPHVVGTLWNVDDETALDLARDFYTALKDERTGTFDTTRAARALHDAVRRQRDLYPGTPSLWAAHLHAGA